MNKKLCLSIIFLSLGINSKAGGPWLQKKKSGLAQIQLIVPAYSYSSLLMGTFINETQGINRKVFNLDYSVYLEYGLSDKLDLITTLPFKYVKTGELTNQQHVPNLLPEGDLHGLSNYQLALKYGLIDKKIKVAVSIHSRWNTISKNLDKGLATGFDANSFGIMAHVGRSSEKHYGFLEVGFHTYTNNFSDVVEINLEHGWILGKRWNLALVLNARHSLENGSYHNENLTQTGLYPNDQSWAAVSGKVAYEKENGWGINAALPLIPIKFKYVGYNGTINLGVFKKF